LQRPKRIPELLAPTRHGGSMPPPAVMCTSMVVPETPVYAWPASPGWRASTSSRPKPATTSTR
jgi:hypothetical protein